MNKGWLDAFALVLAALVVGIACIDFLLGKRGRKRLQLGVENAWLQLSYVRLPTLGLSEAQAFVRLLDKIFGPRLFSVHRFVATLLLVSVLMCAAYAVYEAARILDGKEFRWPFQSEHWDTGFPSQVLPGMLSISITRTLVSATTRLVGQSRWSTPAFLIAIGVAGYASLVCSITIGLTMEVAHQFISLTIATPLHIVTHMDEIPDPSQRYALEVLPPIWWGMIKHAMQGSYLAITHPFAVWEIFMSVALGNDSMIRAYYDMFVAGAFGGIRVLFAVVFIGSWLLLPPLKWLSSLLLLRLGEAERGSLTAISAGVALLAKLIQEFVKGAT